MTLSLNGGMERERETWTNNTPSPNVEYIHRGSAGSYIMMSPFHFLPIVLPDKIKQKRAEVLRTEAPTFQ